MTQKPGSITCPHCGQPQPPTAVLCSFCLKKLNPPTPDRQTGRSASPAAKLPVAAVPAARSAATPQSPPPGTPSPTGDASWVDSRPEKNNLPGIIAVSITLLLMVASGFAWMALQPAGVQVPTAYETFKDGDGQFALERPRGWEVMAAARGNGVMSAASFTSGPARIVVHSDLKGSLMGDIVRASQASQSQPIKTPAQKVHEMGEEETSRKFGNYQESEARRHATPLGETWVSEFTGQGGFRVGPVRGFRATALGGERRITLLCVAPADKYPELEPAFRHALESLRAGGGT